MVRADLIFPKWCSILELVRTHFVACGGEEIFPRKFGKAAAYPVAPPKADGIGEPHE